MHRQHWGDLSSQIHKYYIYGSSGGQHHRRSIAGFRFSVKICSPLGVLSRDISLPHGCSTGITLPQDGRPRQYLPSLTQGAEGAQCQCNLSRGRLDMGSERRGIMQKSKSAL